MHVRRSISAAPGWPYMPFYGGIFYFVFDYGAFPSKLGPFTGSGFIAPDGATPSIGTMNLLNGQVVQVSP